MNKKSVLKKVKRSEPKKRAESKKRISKKPKSPRAKPRASIPKNKPLNYKRNSPKESATIYSAGYMKEGNDGNMYVVKADKNGVKRWVKA